MGAEEGIRTWRGAPGHWTGIEGKTGKRIARAMAMEMESISIDFEKKLDASQVAGESL